MGNADRRGKTNDTIEVLVVFHRDGRVLAGSEVVGVWSRLERGYAFYVSGAPPLVAPTMRALRNEIVRQVS
jgi:hypothetical protein